MRPARTRTSRPRSNEPFPSGVSGAADRPGNRPEGRVLLLVTSSSYRAEDFLSAAERVGVAVTVASDHEQAFAGVAPAASLFVDFSESDRAVSTVAKLHREHPLAAIVAAEDEGTILASAASAAIGLPHNPLEAVRTAQRKDRFRETLRQAGLPSPRFVTFGIDEDPDGVAGRATEHIGFPCVVKPVSLAASRGVIRANDESELAAAFRRVVRIASTAGRPGDAREIIVEDYMPGAEVALEGLLVDGELRTLAVLDKPDPLEGPYFEETLFVTPSRLPQDEQTAIRRTAGRVARALGLSHGPVHAEMRVNDDGVWALEMAPRSIGGLCSRMFRFQAGVALEELILLHAIGAPIEERPTPTGPAGVMMIPIPRAGRFVKVEGIEAARSLAGIEDVVISLRPGQEVVPLPEGNQYLGFIFARTADGPDAVECALREAHACLKIAIE